MASFQVGAKTVKAWSFSRYSDYVQCPLKFKLKVIDGYKEPGNDAMARGNAIHKSAEEWIKGINKSRTVPEELRQFEELFKEMRKLYKKATAGIVVEDDWAFTREWTRTQWDDWTGCWIRIKLDCASNVDPKVLIVNDWKTGKFREEMNETYVEQLELYALAGLLLHPEVETVLPRLVYLDLGMIYPSRPEDVKRLTFTRADVPKLKASWEKRVKPMFTDKRFAPKPNDKCRWCYFGQSQKARAGGPGLCKF